MSSAPFAFTAKNMAEYEAIMRRYPVRRAALLPTLHLAQLQHGFITVEIEEYVARLLEVPAVDVHEVVTFYSLFFKRPMGKHHIRVCMSISCMLGDCAGIRDHLQRRLGVESGGVTDDGRFSWEAVPDCLGACEIAPMMQLDGEFYGNLDAKKVDELLAKVDGSGGASE